MRSKRYRQYKERLEENKKYSLDESVQLISQMKSDRCDQTVDVAIRLGVDPKQSDQQVRGAANLPHGLGKKVVVLAFAKGEKEKEATDAGADYVGGDNLVQKISDGWFGFDKVVATPDMMPVVSKVGKLLGPRGFMPNPKTGTLTPDIGKAVKECKAGKATFKTEKGSIIHCPIGKVSFGPQKLKENLLAMIEEVQKLKPSTSKGIYFQEIALSATHSPGIRLDVSSVIDKGT